MAGFNADDVTPMVEANRYSGMGFAVSWAEPVLLLDEVFDCDNTDDYE